LDAFLVIENQADSHNRLRSVLSTVDVMQLRLLIFAMSLLFLVAPQNKSQSERTRTPVEIWCGGDDDLTRRVCHAADNAFSTSSDFITTDIEQPGMLVVTVSHNVQWKELGKRTKVYLHGSVHFC